jgi:PTS system cellobiose-specific IIC component
MDVKSIIMWIALFAIDVIILLPFVRIYDKQMLAEEMGTENQ